MRTSAAFSLLLLLAAAPLSACDDDTNPTDVDALDDTDADPQPTATIAADPNLEGVVAFPDDRYTIASTETVTGLQVTYSSETDSSIDIPIMQNLADQIAELDGFGTTAGAWLRFTNPIDAETVIDGTASADLDANLIMGTYDGSTLEIVPIEANINPRPAQIVLRPMLPLPPASQAFFAATTGILDQNGAPIVPNDDLAAILAGDNPTGSENVAPTIREIATALEASGYISSPDDLAALHTFTTQSIHEVDLSIAAEIADTDFTVDSYEGCTDKAFYRECDIVFTVPNFMNNDGNRIVGPTPNAARPSYPLNARIYLPLEDVEASQPYPTSIFGHGLTGNRSQANLIARHIAPLGIATISIDAPQHGTHPLAENPGGDSPLDVILPLFGIQLEGGVNLDGFILRDGWRHSNLDKLGLVELIRSGIDTDDNEVPDLDINQLSYLGASLGAIQGSEFLALSTDLSAGLYAVGGARIVDIVQFSDTFSSIVGLLLPGAPPAEFFRFYVILQTVIEAGDGANWAPYVLQNRLNNGPIPDIAAQMSIPDAIVPNPTNVYLARALGLSTVGTVVLPDPLLPAASAPVSANHPSGATAAILQTDYITDDGNFVESTHDDSPASEESVYFWSEALTTHFFEGTMVLPDPYVDLNRTRPPE